MNLNTVYTSMVKRAAAGALPEQPAGQPFQMPPPIAIDGQQPQAAGPRVIDQDPGATEEETNQDLIAAFKQLMKTVGHDQSAKEQPMEPAPEEMPPDVAMQAQPKLASLIKTDIPSFVELILANR